MIKRTICLGIVLTLMLTLTTFAEDNDYKMDENGNLIKVDENFDKTVKVTVNGIEINFSDAKPFINKQDRTVVPVRFIAEALGAKVGWNGETRTVIIDQESKHIELKIGAMEAVLNNETVKFDTKAEIYFSRTFVPLRFISETLGAKVGWIGESKTVTIDTNSEQPEQPTTPVAQNIEEIIKKLKDNELKEVVKNVPNTYVAGRETGKDIMYNSDGKTGLYDAEIMISYSEHYKNTLVTVYPEIYKKDYSALKDILKTYYPTKYETVYTYVSDIIDNGKQTTKKAEEFSHDNRSFACKKVDGATNIYIGGKANE